MEPPSSPVPAALMVFLILAAQYERWSLPLSVMLALPFGTFGALTAMDQQPIAPWVHKPLLTNDIYFQIGLVTLLGLAAKNAILIVEYALMKKEEGLSASAAAVEAARLRFRPILMTSLAFILGVVPLVLSTGAGAGARHSVGTGVMGGMFAATFLAIFFVPFFFRLIFERRITESRSKDELHAEIDHAHALHARPTVATPGHPRIPNRRRILIIRRKPVMEANMRNSILTLASASALAGCAVTQPKPPELDLPLPTATAEQNALLARWWTAFDDPVLTALVEEAFANNLDLRGALARIEAARADVLLAQSNLAPSINLRGGASRSRQSQRTAQAAGFAIPASNDYSIGIETSYELDIWGKYRSGALAAANDLVAAQYYRETVRISVAAETANAYFRLRAADALLVVLEDTRNTRTDTVKLQQDRFDGGIIGEYDLRQAEAELSAVVADIARARQAIGLLESAIATLTGRSPRAVFTPEIARGATIEAATSVPQLPSGLPSGLLERRPDIRRSEALLAASDLRIQQARADYFPSVNLTGAYGTESAALSSLFTPAAAVWRFGAGLVQPLLALKAIESQVEAATARRDAVTVDYQQTVQTAFREVHDALVTNRSAGEVLAAETQRREQLRQALAVANLRYEAGRTSFLEVLDAQRTLLAAETLRIAAARDSRLSIVDFAKALGGGWERETYTAAY